MKRTVLSILLIFAAVMSVTAQQFDNPQILTRVGLTEQEVENVTDIWVDTEREIQAAQLELNILKAQLDKLLFPADADMKAIEKVIRASAEMEITVKLATIDRRVRIRKVFGEDRWEKYIRLQRQIRQKQQADTQTKVQERAAKDQ